MQFTTSRTNRLWPRLAGVTLAGALFLPTIASAQSSSSDGHSGFHAAVGLAGGSAGFTCTYCSTDRTNGGSLMLRFGGAVSPGVVLSAELTAWSRDANNATSTLSWATFVAQWYPQPASGFYVKGGVGGAALKETAFVPGFGDQRLETNNFGFEVGTGYDIHISHGFSVTPFADFLSASPANAQLNGSNTGVQVGANVFHIGVAASWR